MNFNTANALVGPTELAIEWAVFGALSLAVAHAYYKLFFDRSSNYFVHLTNSSITIPINSAGKTVSSSYRSITRVEKTWSYDGGHRINIWHAKGSNVISGSLLVEDDLERIYAHIQSRVGA